MFYKIKTSFSFQIYFSLTKVFAQFEWFEWLSFPGIRLAPLNNMIENYTVLHIKS